MRRLRLPDVPGISGIVVTLGSDPEQGLKRIAPVVGDDLAAEQYASN